MKCFWHSMLDVHGVHMDKNDAHITVVYRHQEKSAPVILFCLTKTDRNIRLLNVYTFHIKQFSFWKLWFTSRSSAKFKKTVYSRTIFDHIKFKKLQSGFISKTLDAMMMYLISTVRSSCPRKIGLFPSDTFNINKIGIVYFTFYEVTICIY